MTDVPPHAVWSALLAVGGGYEAFALMRRHEATLSHLTRQLARTHTRTGRWAFAIGWTAFSGWFMTHVLWPEKVPSL